MSLSPTFHLWNRIINIVFAALSQIFCFVYLIVLISRWKTFQQSNLRWINASFFLSCSFINIQTLLGTIIQDLDKVTIKCFIQGVLYSVGGISLPLLIFSYIFIICLRFINEEIELNNPNFIAFFPVLLSWFISILYTVFIPFMDGFHNDGFGFCHAEGFYGDIFGYFNLGVIGVSIIFLFFVIIKVIVILKSIHLKYQPDDYEGEEEYKESTKDLKIKTYFTTFITYFIAELFLAFLFGFDQIYLSKVELGAKTIDYVIYIIMQIIYGGMGGIVILIFDYKKLVLRNIKYIICCEGNRITLGSFSATEEQQEDNIYKDNEEDNEKRLYRDSYTSYKY